MRIDSTRTAGRARPARRRAMTRRGALVLLACVAGLAAGCATNCKCGLVQGLAEKYADAVVQVKVVTSTRFSVSGREAPAMEREFEVLGTVLDETGLIVTSHSAVDPSSIVAAMRPGAKIDSQIKSTKLIRPDGTEVPLKVVLRDKDLDLMFLRPTKRIRLAHIDLKARGADLRLGNVVVVVSRLGPVGDRQPMVSLGRVQAVVDKPRRFCVAVLPGGATSLGCPVFTCKGELAGLMVIRTSKVAGSGSALGGAASRVLPIILPIADILEDMGQIEKPEE